MGERKCAFEGCNALEFRTTGFCLRHKSGDLVEGLEADRSTKNTNENLEEYTYSHPAFDIPGEGSDSFSSRTVLGIICFIIGFGFVYNGILILPVTSWFGELPGMILILIGGYLFVGGYGLIKS